MKTTIINQSSRAVPRAFLLKWIKRMEKLASKKIAPKRFAKKELVIVFLNEKDARNLNKRYRGKNYATDVLSFMADQAAGADPDSLGELVICPSVISRQAKEHGLLVREELGYMVLHGFLHLLGYDHETSEKDAEEMFALQDAIFEKLLARRV